MAAQCQFNRLTGSIVGLGNWGDGSVRRLTSKLKPDEDVAELLDFSEGAGCLE